MSKRINRPSAVGVARVPSQVDVAIPATATTARAPVRIDVRAALAERPVRPFTATLWNECAPASADTKSCAEAKRSAGSFARALRTVLSTCGGTVSRTARGGVGRSVITLATMACTVEPVNGGSPVSISYSTAPSA